MPLTFGSLFSGIGGIDLGFERAGFNCKWQVEIDEYASKVLQKHWPSVHRERDIRECGAHNLERVDIIAGGFPCQDISYAGRGAGLDGARSGLWYEFARIVREMEPRFVVVENVWALLTRGLDRVLGSLASLGYDAEWSCVPAGSLGAPSIRRRIFIIAYRMCARGSRLEQAGDTCVSGSWGWRGEKDLRDISDRPFAPGTSWPQPLLRRMDDGVSGRMDRLRCLGNAVVPQVAEFVGKRILSFA